MSGFKYFFTTISVLFALSELEPTHIKFSGYLLDIMLGICET
jgi:hypothetical protein